MSNHLDSSGNFSVNIEDQCFASVSKFTNAEGEVVYRLYWTDGVVNDWEEFYDSLALALSRLAVLAECVAEEKGFASEGSNFANFGQRFLNNQAV